MATRPKKKWTEEDLLNFLDRRYPEPGYIVARQVRTRTGANYGRIADAVVASLYPSRGLYLMGVEVKCSLSDWRTELKDPQKSYPIQKYCKYWTILAPKGIVPVEELPETWGLLEATGRGISIAKKPPQLDPEPLSMPFFMSFVQKVNARRYHKDYVNGLLTENRQLRQTIEQHNEVEDLKKASEEARHYYRLVNHFESAAKCSIQDLDCSTLKKYPHVIRMIAQTPNISRDIDSWKWKIERNLRSLERAHKGLTAVMELYDQMLENGIEEDHR